MQVEDTLDPSARSAPAIVLCDNTVLGDPVPGLLCDPVVGDAVLWVTKVTAFNPFKARAVVGVGALHWSCKVFFWVRIFLARGKAAKSGAKSKSLSKEKDVEGFVAQISFGAVITAEQWVWKTVVPATYSLAPLVVGDRRCRR